MESEENKEKEEPQLFQSAIDAEKASSNSSPLFVGVLAGVITFIALALFGLDAKLTLIIAIVVGASVAGIGTTSNSN